MYKADELNLSMDVLPKYMLSAYRKFAKKEKHITRTIPENVLILMVSGSLYFTEDGVDTLVQAGEYYIQKPNTYHEGPMPSDAPNYYFIHFVGHYNKAGALPLRGQFNIDHIQPIIEKIEALGGGAEKIEYEHLFYNLLTTLKNDLSDKTVAEKMRAYLLENYTSPIHLDDLNKISLLSINQTINVFRNTYGTTPHKYLTEFRLQKASELILATNLPINEICYQVGFTEYSSFFKLFSQRHGKSPQDYRKSYSTNTLPEGLYYQP
jgi:AraC-like DNA-binding protein